MTTRTTEQHVADAFRRVAVKLQNALENGRSERIDVHDLFETLLSIADELDPEFSDDHQPTP